MKKRILRGASALLAIVMVLLMLPVFSVPVRARGIRDVDDMQKLGTVVNLLKNEYIGDAKKSVIFISVDGVTATYMGDSKSTSSYDYVSSMSEYFESRAASTNVDFGVGRDIKAKLKIMFAEVEVRNKFQLDFSHSEGAEGSSSAKNATEYALFEYLHKIGTYQMSLRDKTQIARVWEKNILNADFVEALLTWEPEDFFNEYGSHIITGYDAGGTATSSYYGNMHYESGNQSVSRSDSVSGEMDQTVFSIHGKVASDYAASSGSSGSGTIKQGQSTARGGEGNFSWDADSASAWAASINEENHTVLVDENLKLLPVWDLLIDDSQLDRKIELEQYFNDHVDSQYADLYGEYIYSPLGDTDYTDYTFIRTAEEFNNIRNDLGGKYVLLNNIDLSVYPEWAPIGTSIETAFTGILDGNGNTVSGLKVTEYTNGVAGLFGYNSGSIRNLCVNGEVNVNASGNVGSIGYIGGIVGYNLGLVENCCNRVSVNGSINVTGEGQMNAVSSAFEAYADAIAKAKAATLMALTNGKTVYANPYVRLTGTASNVTIEVSGTADMEPVFIVLENAHITGTIKASGDRKVFIISTGEANSITGATGATAINAPAAVVCITGTAPLTITGGNGKGGGIEEKGADGVVALNAAQLSSDAANVIFRGGDGGIGGNGNNGSNGSNGGNGADGGKGGMPIHVSGKVYVLAGETVLCYGNGGRGGNGGFGGVGINGADGKDAYQGGFLGAGWYCGEAGKNGSTGGNGGNGGNGGEPDQTLYENDSFECRSLGTVLIYCGQPGDGGNGGEGGVGGNGGTGGSCDYMVTKRTCSNGVYDCTCGGNGGNGGTGGAGGNGGSGYNPGVAGTGGNGGIGGIHRKTKKSCTCMKDGTQGSQGNTGKNGSAITTSVYTLVKALEIRSDGFNGWAYCGAENASTAQTVASSSDNPTGKAYELKVLSKACTHSYHAKQMGGYMHPISVQENREYYYVILAKIPVGYTIEMLNNFIGDDARKEWLTDNKGTGEWTWYIGKTKTGTGDYARKEAIGYIAISKIGNKPQGEAGETVEWRVASSAIYEYDSAAYNAKLITETHEYQSFTFPLPWIAARKLALAQGGLVSIGSAAEEALIEKLVSYSEGTEYWIGLKTLSYDEATQTVICEWEDGSRIKVVGKGSAAKVYRLDAEGNVVGEGYADFNEGEPNNQNNELYHHITKGIAWNDSQEKIFHGYITEKRLKTISSNSVEHNAVLVGGIAGYNGGRIRNICNHGKVTVNRAASEAGGISAYAGGIAGYNNGIVAAAFNGGGVEAFAISGSMTAYADAYAKNIAHCSVTGKLENCAGDVVAKAIAYSANALTNEVQDGQSVAGTDPRVALETYWNNSKIEIRQVYRDTYLTETELDRTSLELYYNGSRLEAYTVRNNFYKCGTGLVTIVYQGLTRTIPVRVVAAAPVSVEIVGTPKTEYILGEDFSTNGFSLRLIYNNGKEQLLSSKKFSVSAPDMSRLGKQTVTVTYQADEQTQLTCNYEINLSVVAMKEIQIFRMPDKLVYWQGEILSSSGMIVQKHFNNCNVENIDLADPALTFYYDFSVAGTQTVRVFYNGFETTFDCTVNEVALTRIEILTLPRKTTYVQGESLNPQGLTVKKYFSNGTEEIVTEADEALQYEADFSAAGEKTVMVRCGNCTASFTCQVLTEEEHQQHAPRLVVEQKKACAGNKVEVKIYLENNPGIMAARLHLAFDPQLTLVSASAGEALGTLDMTLPGQLVNNCDFIWDSLETVDISSGTVLTLLFLVPEAAEVGTEYWVEVSYQEKDVIDGDFAPVALTTVSGGITVTEFRLGDLNGDGQRTIADLLLLRRYMAGGYGVEIDERVADVNQDGTISIGDVIWLRRYIAGGYGIELD